jgi:hypothetical protein
MGVTPPCQSQILMLSHESPKRIVFVNMAIDDEARFDCMRGRRCKTGDHDSPVTAAITWRGLAHRRANHLLVVVASQHLASFGFTAASSMRTCSVHRGRMWWLSPQEIIHQGGDEDKSHEHMPRTHRKTFVMLIPSSVALLYDMLSSAM